LRDWRAEKFFLNLRFAVGRFCCENRKQERDDEKSNRQPRCELRKHVRRLGSKDIVSKTATEGGTQALTAWTLHEDHENHQQADEDVQRN
jgi:hypothetical protein